jgi:hypothetical protein
MKGGESTPIAAGMQFSGRVKQTFNESQFLLKALLSLVQYVDGT